MKPITASLKVANWLFRGSLLIYLILFYFEKIIVVNFGSFSDVLYFVYVLSGLLLFIGGFLSKPTLSIIAGILVSLCTLYFMFTHLPAEFTKHHLLQWLAYYIWPLGIGLYFTGSDN